jgi:hypothetical protein
LKYLFLLFLFGVSLYFLIGSSAVIGLASNENEPWKYLYLFCFISLLLIPCLFLILVLKSRSQERDYKNQLQKKLNFSLVAIIFLVFFSELSLTTRTNIRIDLLLVIPALITHVLTFLFFTFNIKKRA